MIYNLYDTRNQIQKQLKIYIFIYTHKILETRSTRLKIDKLHLRRRFSSSATAGMPIQVALRRPPTAKLGTGEKNRSKSSGGSKYPPSGASRFFVAETGFFFGGGGGAVADAIRNSGRSGVRQPSRSAVPIGFAIL